MSESTDNTAQPLDVDAPKRPVWDVIADLRNLARSGGMNVSLLREAADRMDSVVEDRTALFNDGIRSATRVRELERDLAAARREAEQAQAELARVTADRNEVRELAARRESELIYLRRTLDTANATNAAAQRIVTAALADGTATITPAAAAADSGPPWEKRYAEMLAQRDTALQAAGQAQAEQFRRALEKIAQEIVGCRMEDVHPDEEISVKWSRLRDLLATPTAAPQATCSCKWSPVQGGIWCDSCAAARDAALAAAAAPKATNCAACGHPWPSHDASRCAECGCTRESFYAWKPDAAAPKADEPKRVADVSVYYSNQTGSHGWRCATCGDQSRPIMPAHAAEDVMGLHRCAPLPVATPDPADTCRKEHPASKQARERHPGWHTRIVDCDLPAGHEGDHEETDTGNTWPQAAGAGDGEQDNESLFESYRLPDGTMPQSIPVTDPEHDAPDGAVVDGYTRRRNTWERNPVAAPDADSGETEVTA